MIIHFFRIIFTRLRHRRTRLFTWDPMFLLVFSRRINAITCGTIVGIFRRFILFQTRYFFILLFMGDFSAYGRLFIRTSIIFVLTRRQRSFFNRFLWIVIHFNARRVTRCDTSAIRRLAKLLMNRRYINGYQSFQVTSSNLCFHVLTTSTFTSNKCMVSNLGLIRQSDTIRHKMYFGGEVLEQCDIRGTGRCWDWCGLRRIWEI